MPLQESSNTLSVDCDGVIADKNHGGDYSKAGPLHYGIEQVNKLYDEGYIIILYTARYGDRERVIYIYNMNEDIVNGLTG